MRLWEGIEKEGAQIGIKTLFVESKRITYDKLLLIRDVAKKRSISRIYLGAGKVDIIYLYKKWYEILKKIEVVVETTSPHIRYLSSLDAFSSVVVRIDIDVKEYSNIIPKIDNKKVVTLYYNGVENSISTVKNGMYTDTDKEIVI